MASKKQRREALLRIRIIWSTLLVSPFMFFISLLSHKKTTSTLSDREVMLLFYVTMAMLLVGVPVGYFIRSQTYKRCWQQDTVTPAGYVGGNVVLLGICLGVVILSLITMYISGQLWPYLLPMVLALAVQVVNFPHGLPMEPTGTVQQL